MMLRSPEKRLTTEGETAFLGADSNHTVDLSSMWKKSFWEGDASGASKGASQALGGLRARLQAIQGDMFQIPHMNKSVEKKLDTPKL